MPDLLLGRIRVLGQQLSSHEHEPGRAETALESAGFDKCLLDRVEPIFTNRLLDRDDDVIDVAHGDALSLDRIAKGRLAAYESTGITPEELSGPGAGRFIEPVVVGGIVTGLVYLFYTNQN